MGASFKAYALSSHDFIMTKAVTFVQLRKQWNTSLKEIQKKIDKYIM